MKVEDEAKKYIDELKKKGVRLYRIADSSPETLERELSVSREVAKHIIDLAKSEIIERMYKKSKSNKLRMLPHVGQKRAEILRSKNISVKKIAGMNPEQLMKEVPHLRRREAEDIILAAELLTESNKEFNPERKDEFMKLPYMSVSRRAALKRHKIGIKEIAKMKPEELMELVPNMKRSEAEKIIIAAELNLENKRESLKAPHPDVNRKNTKIKALPAPRPGRLKRGLVNGNSLVNGRGVVNGLGMAKPPHHTSKLPVALIIVAILLSALVPIMFFTPHNAISIDGTFSDWKDVRGVYDPFGIKDGSLIQAKGTYSDNTLFIYAKFAQPIFHVPEGVYVLVDADGNNHTGYVAGSIGADFMIKVTGWNDTVQTDECYVYRGTNQYNWSAFVDYSAVHVAFKGNEMEISTHITATEKLSFLVVEKEYASEDNILIPISPKNYGAFVYANSTASEISSEHYTGIESIAIYPFGNAQINITLTPFGNFSNVNYSVRFTDSEGNVLKYGTQLEIKTSKNETLHVEVRATGFGTIGFKVHTDTPNINIINNVTSVRAGVTNGIKIDGNFRDWQNINGAQDPRWDVQPYSKFVHENIDIKEVKRSGKFFYIQTYANILEGNIIPEIVQRLVPDSDRDTVPDYLDPYPHDFNNDGIPDNESYVVVNGNREPDVDGDGVADYPYGPDMWLNTTIPANFPKPYAGRHVSIYIGPVPEVELTGNDTFMVFIEDKNGTYHAPFLPFKALYRILITSRGQQASATLERYSGEKWIGTQAVKIALAGDQMEGNSMYSGNIFVLSEDWMRQHDMCNPTGDGSFIVKKENITIPRASTTYSALIIDGSVNGADNPYFLGNANGTVSYYNYSYIDIINGAYVIVRGKVVLNLHGTDSNGRSFYIDSTSVMSANGTGYAGGAGGTSSTHTGANGTGIGGGGGGEPSKYRSYTLPIGAGGGGGGYGGTGGTGGNTNLPQGYQNGAGGTGGTTYGTDTGSDIDMGSGGGGGGGDTAASSTVPFPGYGGNGSGCIEIFAENVVIDGMVYANGEKGWDSIYGGGGGGGSGGGILIQATNVTINGLLAADGGDGGNSKYGGAGGGGGGGRIKIFYSNTYTLNGAIEVNGGVSGTNGAYGLAGKTGTTGSTYSAKVPEISDHILLGIITLMLGVYLRKKKNI